MADNAFSTETQAPKAAVEPEMASVSPEPAPEPIPGTDRVVGSFDAPSPAPEFNFGSSSVPVDRSNGQGTAVVGQVGSDVPEVGPSLLPPPSESNSMGWPAVAGITMGVIFILSVMLAALYMLYTCRVNARRRREGLDEHSPGKQRSSFTTPNRPFLPNASPRRSGHWRTAPLDPPYSGSPPPPFLQHWIDTLLPETQLDPPYNPASNPNIPPTAPVLTQSDSASTEEPHGTLARDSNAVATSIRDSSGHTDTCEQGNAAQGTTAAAEPGAGQEVEMAVVSGVGYTAVSGLEPTPIGRVSGRHLRGLSHTASHMMNSSTFVSANSGEVTSGVFAVTGSLLEEPPSGPLNPPAMPEECGNDDVELSTNPVSRSAPQLRTLRAQQAAQRLDSHHMAVKDVSDASELAELDSPGPHAVHAHDVGAPARANVRESVAEEANTTSEGFSEHSGDAAPVAEAASCMDSSHSGSHGYHASRPGPGPSNVHVGYMHEQPQSIPSDHDASQLGQMNSIASSYCGAAIQQGGKRGQNPRARGVASDSVADACASGRISQGLPPIPANPSRHRAQDSIASELENPARMHSMQPSVLKGTYIEPLPADYPPSYAPTISQDASSSTLPGQVSFKSPFRKTHTITARACYSQAASGTWSLEFTESERATLPATIETIEDQEAVSTGGCTSRDGMSSGTIVSMNNKPAPNRHQAQGERMENACIDNGVSASISGCEDGTGVQGLGTVPEASVASGVSTQKTVVQHSVHSDGNSNEKQLAFGASISGGASGSPVSRCVDSQLTDLSTLMHERCGAMRTYSGRSTEEEHTMHVMYKCGTTVPAAEDCDQSGMHPTHPSHGNSTQPDAAGTEDTAVSDMDGLSCTPTKVPTLQFTRSAGDHPHLSMHSRDPKSANRRLGNLFADVKATWKGLRTRWGSRRAPLGPGDLEVGCMDPHSKIPIARTAAIRQSAFASSGSSASMATSGVHGDVSSSDVSSHAASETYTGAPMHSFQASAASVMHACSTTGMHAFDALRHMHGPSTVASEDVASVVINVPVETQSSRGTDFTSEGVPQHTGGLPYVNGSGVKRGASYPAQMRLSKGSKHNEVMQTMHAYTVSSGALSMVRNSSSSSKLAPATPSWTHQSPSAGAAVGGPTGMQFVGSPNHPQNPGLVSMHRSRSGSGGSTPPAYAFHAQHSGPCTPSTQTSQESPSLHVPANFWGHEDSDMHGVQHAQRCFSPVASAMHKPHASNSPMRSVHETAARSQHMHLTSTEGYSSTEYSGSPVKHTAPHGRSVLSTNTTAVMSESTHSSTNTPTAGYSPVKAAMHATAAYTRILAPRRTPQHAWASSLVEESVNASLLLNRTGISPNGVAPAVDPIGAPPPDMSSGAGPLPVDLTDEDVCVGIKSPSTHGAASHGTNPLPQLMQQSFDLYPFPTTKNEMESVTACMPGCSCCDDATLATNQEDCWEEGSEPEASTLELKEYLERTLQKMATGPSTSQLAKRVETPPAAQKSHTEVGVSVELPKSSKLRWKSVKNFTGGDKSGPSDGDTDDIGGVWMSLPGDTAHEVNALSSAPDTDVLYDASNTLSITLGVAPRVDEESPHVRAAACPAQPRGASSKSLYSGSFGSTCDPPSPVSLSTRPALRAASKARTVSSLRRSKAPPGPHHPPSHLAPQDPHLYTTHFSCSTRLEESGPCMSDVEGSGSIEASGRCKVLCAHAPVATATCAESTEYAAHSSAALSSRGTASASVTHWKDSSDGLSNSNDAVHPSSSTGALVAIASARKTTMPMLAVPGDVPNQRLMSEADGYSTSSDAYVEGYILEASAVAPGGSKIPSPRPRPRTPRALAQRLPSTVPEDSMVKETSHSQNPLVESSGILQWPSGVSAVSGSTTTGTVRPSKYDLVESGALTSVHTVLSGPRRSNDTELSVSKYEVLGESALTTLVAADTLPSNRSDANSLSITRSVRAASPSPPQSLASEHMHAPRGHTPDSMHERSEAETAFMTPAGSVWAGDSVSLMGADDSGTDPGTGGGISNRMSAPVLQYWSRLGLLAETSEASVEVVHAS